MNPPLPRITVAMSVYNNEAFLAAAIDSILAQTFEDFEFLIVNDGSKDRSAAIIDELAARDSRIRPIHQENRGLIASLNRMISEARAPIIARMDGDDIALPERFSKQIAFLNAHPEVGVLGTNVHDMDEAGNNIPTINTYPLSHASIQAAFGSRPTLAHPSVMIRTDTVRAVGAYRSAYHYCEDYDLWLRLSTVTQLANLPEKLLRYRRSTGQVSVRHSVRQGVNAAIAWLAYQERQAGRPDPTDGVAEMPPLEALDSLFGRLGVAREVRAAMVPKLLYSGHTLKGGGLELIKHHVMDGGSREGLWRTVVRMFAMREPGLALRLATLLALQRSTSPE